MHRGLMLGILMTLFLIWPVLGHVPIAGGDNDHLDTALTIDDPTKSWVVYDGINHGGEARYYRLEMRSGDRLVLGLFTPERSSFVPEIVIMGPDLPPSGTFPQYIEIPENYGAIGIAGSMPDTADYEPFTPSALYPVAEFSEEIIDEGSYFIAVYEPDNAGNFGLAIGYREEFSLSEWLLVSIAAIGIHLWEGQSLAFIASPLIAVLIAGFAYPFAINRKAVPESAFGWIAYCAALLYIGSAGMVFLQIVVALSRTGFDPAMLVTLIFVALPLILGVAALRLSYARDTIDQWDRLKILIIGMLGFAVWAGVLLGPVLACIASITPARVSRGS